MPDSDPHVPSEAWPLSAEGSALAEQLGRWLPSDAVYFSSTERRAKETLGASSRSVESNQAFDEVRRHAELWEGPYRELRAAWVRGNEVEGWEEHGDAFVRFDGGVHAVLDRRPSCVIATHGMVLTNWLVGRGVVAPAEAGSFWAGLQFPDLLLVEIDAQRVVRVDDWRAT